MGEDALEIVLAHREADHANPGFIAPQHGDRQLIGIAADPGSIAAKSLAHRGLARLRGQLGSPAMEEIRGNLE